MPRDNNIPSQFKRELTMTEDEEMVLVEMCQFFIENGWINEEREEAFESLTDKVCEPSPFDYV